MPLRQRGCRRAQKVMLPVLDILQSVPILGFLSVTITGFIALFPGSQLGLECASIFAIFTSQAWNMTFAFYHSLSSQPRDLDEAARNLRLSRWQRFWRIDVPSGMIPLVWNGMMSFGGGWFFLVASEALSVNNHHYALPGIGSYVATATADGDLGKVFIAIGVMVDHGGRCQRGVLAATDRMGRAIPRRRVGSHRSAAERRPELAAALARPDADGAAIRLAGCAAGSVDGGIRVGRASVADLTRRVAVRVTSSSPLWSWWR